MASPPKFVSTLRGVVRWYNTSTSASTANVTTTTSSNASLYQQFHSGARQRLPFSLPVVRPVFVISMGWYRWGAHARRRWMIELLNASTATANLCREWLAADRREQEGWWVDDGTPEP